MSVKSDLRLAYQMGYDDAVARHASDQSKADVLVPHPWAERADKPEEETTDGSAFEAPSDERITDGLRGPAEDACRDQGGNLEMDYSLEDLFEIMRIASDSSSVCGNASENVIKWCDRYGTCNECRAALIDAIKRKISDEHARLPKDADGEYVHVGDVMGDRGFRDAKYTVVGIGEGTFFTRDASGELYKHTASLYIHYKPTVEDVLREFAQKMNENMGMYTGEAIDADEWQQADSKTIAEYAKKLQLAGSDAK